MTHELTLATLNSRLLVARADLTACAVKVAAAEGRADAATPGGLTGYDSAILSGIRRKPNRKATAARFAAYDRAAEAQAEHTRAEEAVALLERQIAARERDDADRARITPDAIKAARFVRDAHGWHRVVRVSARSITVETPWSWTDRIALDRVLEVRA